MTNRRRFLRSLATVGAGISALSLSALEKELSELVTTPLSPPSTDPEQFWRWVQQQYTVSPTLMNLNNGGVSPQPKVVQEAQARYNELANEAPSYYMWRVLDRGRESLRKKLANLAGCSPEEIVVNRNTTEALATIIFGLDLTKGDEVVLCPFDYPNMKQAWKQRELREGIKLRYVSLPMPVENDEEIVEAYRKQITDKTKIVHVTHMINWTGQILPVRKIADMAHEAGAEVIVDGAHTFAHLEYQIPDLGADYFGTSLHKWLCAPFGTGMMYIKKDKIKKIWPTFAPPNPNSDDIRKFEAQGTRSFPAEYGIAQAIEFHNAIGGKRKEERLHYLKHYWLEKVFELPNVISYTSLKPEFSCALATVAIKGLPRNEFVKQLFSKYHIHTTNVAIENVDGVRITPHVYTTEKDLDKLITSISEISKQ